MPITIEYLIGRMEWAARQQLSEYACCTNGHKLTMQRIAGQAANSATVAAPERPPNPAADPAADPAMTAPLAGMCHLRPEAGGAPFVQVGDRVVAGQTLCIIEAMKMMTSIPAEASGTVEAILVTDGETVAAGAPLMRIVA